MLAEFMGVTPQAALKYLQSAAAAAADEAGRKRRRECHEGE